MRNLTSPKDLIAAIMAAAQGKSPFIVALDGFGGSGKTTLANKLVKRLPNAAILQVDDFIRTPAPEQGYPYDYDAFEDSLQHIKTNKTIISKTYDWKTDKKVAETMDVKRFMIVDGVRLLQPRFLPYLDYKIWIDYPLNQAIERGKHRDREEQGVNHDELWDTVWGPLDVKHFEEHRPDRVADVVYKPS